MAQWATGNRYLTDEEMTNNAATMLTALTSAGWTKNAVCGAMGNMQSESRINPGVWQNLAVNWNLGYGFVQWTPATKLKSWADARGLDYRSGDAQVQRIIWETEEDGRQWLQTSEYPISFKEFIASTESPEYLASVFLHNYERPASFDTESTRQQQARHWFDTLGEGFTFTPRLDDSGMQGSPYYYSLNPFYQSGYGLPNCTCYAWGRRYEITGEAPQTSLGNANGWWDYNQANDIYPSGQEPKIGAIACYDYEPGGHVAIVEQINEDGSVVMSNSGYGSQTYFYLTTSTAEQNYMQPGYFPAGARFEGFIYLPFTITPGGGSGGSTTGAQIHHIEMKNQASMKVVFKNESVQTFVRSNGGIWIPKST